MEFEFIISTQNLLKDGTRIIDELLYLNMQKYEKLQLHYGKIPFDKNNDYYKTKFIVYCKGRKRECYVSIYNPESWDYKYKITLPDNIKYIEIYLGHLDILYNNIFYVSEYIINLTSDKNIDVIDAIDFNKVIFSDNLKKLELGSEFNQDISFLKLPLNLECIKFGREFNKNMDNLIFPDNLKEIIFGYEFNESIDNVKFPQSLEKITFGKKFNKSVISLKLLINLKYIDDYSDNIKYNDFFPESLEEITYIDRYRRKNNIYKKIPTSNANIKPIIKTSLV